MPEDQVFDWKKIIKIDASVVPSQRQSIELMLDQMAHDADGIAVFKAIEARTDNNQVLIGTKYKDSEGNIMPSELRFHNQPGTQDEFPAANGANVLNMNFIDDRRAGFVDIRNGNLVPWSENRILFHELAHAGCQTVADVWSRHNTLGKQESDELDAAMKKMDADKAAIPGYAEYDATQKKIADIKNPAKAKAAQEAFDKDPKNQKIAKEAEKIDASISKAVEAIDKKYAPLKEQCVRDIDTLRFTEENRAVALENRYMAKFGEPERAYYKLWKFFDKVPEKSIVLQNKDDRLEKHFVTHEKETIHDLDLRIKELEMGDDPTAPMPEDYKKWGKEIEIAKEQMKASGVVVSRVNTPIEAKSPNLALPTGQRSQNGLS